MKQSKLFGSSVYETPKDEVSKNAQLLIRGGYIDKLMSGVYPFLPLGRRVLLKIESIIREEMNGIGGQEILMSALQKKEDWERTDRWDIDVMMKVHTKLGREFGLGWTHEEAVTPLVQKYVKSYKELPVAVYQIQNKFRDEKRAKSGILRGREFIMKDLYSFHTTEKDLDSFYLEVRDAYIKIFQRLAIADHTFYTYAAGGDFCKYSHEFQTVAEVGEDVIYVCDKCRVAVNEEIIVDLDNKCPECGNQNLVTKKAVESGNIFKLMSRFSDAFGFQFMDNNGRLQPVIMGCYGLGLGRLMGVVVELFGYENGINWPEAIAPYRIHLLAVGNGSMVKQRGEEIYKDLMQSNLEVLYDDREVSAGVKFKDADLIGASWRVIVSEKTLEQNSVEMKKVASTEMQLVKISDLSVFLNR